VVFTEDVVAGAVGQMSECALPGAARTSEKYSATVT
jgi:hypothetical protein